MPTPSASPVPPPAFTSPRTRLTIGSLDTCPSKMRALLGRLIGRRENHLEVSATYNPYKIDISKEVSWLEKPLLGSHNADREARMKHGRFHHEYGGAKGRTMSLELHFDGFETGTSIEGEIQKLEALSNPLEIDSIEESRRRPHHCVVSWGTAMRPFHCVISSLKVSYTMFDRAGMPLRALVAITLTEADVLELDKDVGLSPVNPARAAVGR